MQQGNGWGVLTCPRDAWATQGPCRRLGRLGLVKALGCSQPHVIGDTPPPPRNPSPPALFPPRNRNLGRTFSFLGSCKSGLPISTYLGSQKSGPRTLLPPYSRCQALDPTLSRRRSSEPTLSPPWVQESGFQLPPFLGTQAPWLPSPHPHQNLGIYTPCLQEFRSLALSCLRSWRILPLASSSSRNPGIQGPFILLL